MIPWTFVHYLGEIEQIQGVQLGYSHEKTRVKNLLTLYMYNNFTSSYFLLIWQRYGGV